ncbi:MAG: hypothetical protein KDK99_19605 [Verrucomicrobiales bacterium]|nr:hypothetical protein [Verrucomicrobiales bacterium]
MARPSNNFDSTSLTISVTPQIKVYLEDLTTKGTFGCSAQEAVRFILSKAIDDMLNTGALERRKFKIEGGKVSVADD